MSRSEKQTARRVPIGPILLVAFIVVPLAEIAVLIQVGGWIGLWPTLALIVLTAVIGTAMLRQQGLSVLLRAQRQLEEGTLPVAEVFEGFCLVIAGALLLTPGFITDTAGAVLLIPPVRAALYRQVRHRLADRVIREPSPGSGDRPPPGPTIEVPFEEIEPGGTDDTHREPPPPPRGSWGPRA
jgi:UPF0716 protein FxsA